MGVIAGGLALFVLGGVLQPAFADYALNMTEGATGQSHAVYDLHMTIFWICVVIGVVVYGAMFYSIIQHRKSKGREAAQFHHSTALEIVWTIIPLIILVSMAIPATGLLINMEDTSNSDMTVKVTGYQWKWGYDYVGEGVSYISSLDAQSEEARGLDASRTPESVDHYLRNVDHPLVLPTNTKIRFLITSNDVIHSWWVPDLGWKKDAIPGYVNATWAKIDKPGVYRGQCAELCGRGHAYMPIVVVAKKPEEFQKWLAAQKKKNLPSPEDNAKASASAEGAAAQPVEVAGRRNGVSDAPLSDNGLAAVMTYERDAWVNGAGALAQPSDVRAAR